MNAEREKTKSAMRAFVDAYFEKGYPESSIFAFGVVAGSQEAEKLFNGDPAKPYEVLTEAVIASTSIEDFEKRFNEIFDLLP